LCGGGGREVRHLLSPLDLKKTNLKNGGDITVPNINKVKLSLCLTN
jgi:hypothetical protein